MPEREVVFGQAFHPNDDPNEPLFIVTDTSPRYFPESIAAAQVTFQETEQGLIERLGLPGSFSPETIGQAKEIWSIDRISRAMELIFKGNLPAEMQELLRENAAKPPRKFSA